MRSAPYRIQNQTSQPKISLKRTKTPLFLPFERTVQQHFSVTWQLLWVYRVGFSSLPRKRLFNQVWFLAQAVNPDRREKTACSGDQTWPQTVAGLPRGKPAARIPRARRKSSGQVDALQGPRSANFLRTAQKQLGAWGDNTWAGKRPYLSSFRAIRQVAVQTYSRTHVCVCATNLTSLFDRLFS